MRRWHITYRFDVMVYFFTVVESIIAIVWATAAIAMCLPKGKDYKKLFDTPPYEVWISAIVLALLST